MRLTFQHSLLLGGLVLAMVPVLIHLISRRKAQPVRFAALEFVLRSSRRQVHRLQFQQLLLLLIRILIVVFLVLAVTMPTLNLSAPVASSEQAERIAFCLDVSASMRATVGAGRTAFDLARDEVRATIRGTEPTVPIALYLAGAEVRPLVSPADTERGEVLKALELVEVGYTTSDLGTCVTHAARIERAAGVDAGLRVVVVSDGAAHAWPGRPGTGSKLQVELIRVPRGGLRVDNRALLEVKASAVTSGEERAYDLEVVVQRSADPALEPVAQEITLRADGKPLAQVTALLDAEGRQTKRFMRNWIPRPPGGEVVIEVELVGDPLGFDDRVVLPIELPRRVEALVVDGDPQTVRYRDEVFYLENALGGQVSREGRLQTRVVNQENLRAEQIAEADVVVLANVSSLPAELGALLVSRVKAGSGLLITAGDKLDVDFFNDHLLDILPGRLRGAKSHVPLDRPGEHQIQALEVAAPGHPVMAALSSGESSGLLLVRTRTMMLLEPELVGDRVVLMRFSNGAPAFLEREVGEGRVLLLCTSVDRDWSDLAIRPGFLPLMQQSVLHLAHALAQPRARRHPIGTGVSLGLPRGAVALQVIGPEGERQRLAPSREGSRGVMFNTSSLPGLYRVEAELPGGEVRELARSRFALFVDRAESETALFDTAGLSAAGDGVEIVEHLEQARNQRRVWPYLLLVAALLLVGEVFLGRRR